MARLDAERQAAVRQCLTIIMLPIAVGIAPFVGVLACGASAEVGALMLLTVAACGVTLAAAAGEAHTAGWFEHALGTGPQPTQVFLDAVKDAHQHQGA